MHLFLFIHLFRRNGGAFKANLYLRDWFKSKVEVAPGEQIDTRFYGFSLSAYGLKDYASSYRMVFFSLSLHLSYKLDFLIIYSFYAARNGAVNFAAYANLYWAASEEEVLRNKR